MRLVMKAGPPQLGLTDDAREGVTSSLIAVLADVFVLGMLTRYFHWNVTGPLFSPLHKLFGKQYAQLNDAVDLVAERVRALGMPVPGSALTQDRQRMRVQENVGENRSARTMTQILLEEHERLIRTLRALVLIIEHHYGDGVTRDLLSMLTQNHEKMAWMLRSILDTLPGED
jgi:starvation-inducible DNA-binding protein